VEPACLEIEVTETVLLDRAADRIAQVLAELEGLGVSIALDDFGTGYASLAHLTRLSVHRLKIDRRFVRDIGTGGVPNPIARTVIGLAHGLGMQTVAEGVETEAQRDYLAEHGCDIMQGYLIAKPLTPEGAEAYLSRG
jgi:EAL domain-containing protein (putative c-di-GMP-specific phosphodiesterase class I)